jgi:transposase-like protein
MGEARAVDPPSDYTPLGRRCAFGPDLRHEREVLPSPSMRKSDVTCPKCKAGYRRIELMTGPGTRGEYRCLTCNHVLEVFDGSTEVALRLTVQRMRKNRDKRFSN